MTDVNLLSYTVDETIDEQSGESKAEVNFKPYRPVIYSFVSVAMVLSISFVIVPEFNDIYLKLDVKLPEITHFVLSPGWWMCVSAALLITLGVSFYLQKSIAYVYILLMTLFWGVTTCGLFLPLIVIIERLDA